jgi:hypothetical protein
LSYSYKKAAISGFFTFRILQFPSPAKTAIGMIDPVATELIAEVVLGESVSALQVIGLAIVMVGVRRLHRS